jgi:hypothetical protein
MPKPDPAVRLSSCRAQPAVLPRHWHPGLAVDKGTVCRKVSTRYLQATVSPGHRGIVVALNARVEAAMTIKSRTLRLPAAQAEALEAIAGVDGVSVNEEIQRAITAHIEARQSDPDFRRRLQASIERNREILERLSR